MILRVTNKHMKVGDGNQEDLETKSVLSVATMMTNVIMDNIEDRTYFKQV